MKIMVSACLLGQNCKYNGGNNYRRLIEGRGVFAQLLVDNGIKVLDLEDLYK